MIACGYIGPCNYVSMSKGGTHCIVSKLRWAHFEGSKTPWSADWGVQNSAGQRLQANLPCRVLVPLVCTPLSFGPHKVCPAEFWSNATCALLSHGDINIHRNQLKFVDEVLLKRGENFIDSASSTPEFMFEFTDPSLRGEVNSNTNSGVLELKLHEVHFAHNFSGAELARQRRTCLQGAPSAVSTPMSTKR